MKDYNKKEVIFGAVEMVDELINLPRRRLGGGIVSHKRMYKKLNELWEYPDNPTTLYSRLPQVSGRMRDYFLERGEFKK